MFNLCLILITVYLVASVAAATFRPERIGTFWYVLLGLELAAIPGSYIASQYLAPESLEALLVFAAQAVAGILSLIYWLGTRVGRKQAA